MLLTLAPPHRVERSMGVDSWFQNTTMLGRSTTMERNRKRFAARQTIGRPADRWKAWRFHLPSHRAGAGHRPTQPLIRASLGISCHGSREVTYLIAIQPLSYYARESAVYCRAQNAAAVSRGISNENALLIC